MRVRASIFGPMLVGRPLGRESIREFIAEFGDKPRPVTLDFAGVISVAPSWLEEFVAGLERRGFRVSYAKTRNPSVHASIRAVGEAQGPEPADRRPHPFRLCPLGQHWVRTHPRRTPRGRTSEVDGHCRKNPSKKDSLYADEILAITSRTQPSLALAPLGTLADFEDHDRYDRQILLWVQYWNEVLGADPPLDANRIKALVASESSFDPRTRNGSALGLLQLQEGTIRILGKAKGELKDHLIHLTREKALLAEVNIAAGVRWLHHKRAILSRRLGRQATWDEAVAEYKGYRPRKSEPGAWRNGKGMVVYFKLLEELRR